MKKIFFNIFNVLPQIKYIICIRNKLNWNLKIKLSSLNRPGSEILSLIVGFTIGA